MGEIPMPRLVFAVFAGVALAVVTVLTLTALDANRSRPVVDDDTRASGAAPVPMLPDPVHAVLPTADEPERR